ncbi:hypothetical protein SORBI_3003G178400 [Sorghum bicolor]|uniref:Uncharacterized protein n=1 Tax=Sorghum bicolor TaxID=4558 RepID=A0A1B6Q3Z3_SORBI|nr:hypothetical protein SORBI_3003G178400 [Sorghum bicolor]
MLQCPSSHRRQRRRFCYRRFFGSQHRRISSSPPATLLLRVRMRRGGSLIWISIDTRRERVEAGPGREQTKSSRNFASKHFISMSRYFFLFLTCSNM